MSYNTLLYETDERVALITINRPEVINALSLELTRELQAALEQADAEREIRVIVVKGAGDRAFSSGYDMSESVQEPTVDWLVDRVSHDFKFAYSPWNCSKPVIAMIEGYCLGGGLEFAQMCDIRYCSENAQFSVIETRFGASIVSLVMPWIVGAVSRELIYSGDMFDAATALRIGLVNNVFPADALHDEVMNTAKRIGRVGLDCLKWNKRAINQTYDAMGFSVAMRYAREAGILMYALGSPEAEEFARRRHENGLADAVKWRKELFDPYE